MKKSIIASLIALTAASTATAQLNGDGYYRVCNSSTGRYIYVVDNRGSLNYAATAVDMNAIELWKGLDLAISDPASVLFIEQHGDGYDIRTQGTGLYMMIQAYIKIRLDSRTNDYWAYGSSNGLTKYLSDENPYYFPDPCRLSDNSSKGKNWQIIPIDSNTDNYFGAKPSLTATDGYYMPFFVEFPFQLPAGVKAYYVTSVDEKKGVAVYKEIKGTVPGKTPVILHCTSNEPSLNRLSFIVDNAATPADNLLKGVFFCNDVNGAHRNVVDYKSDTMRSLAVLTDGKPGLVKGDYSYVPRNTFYLPVSSSCPAELKLMTKEEYESGISDVTVDATAEGPVYTIMGVKVKDAGETLEGLAPGVYVRGGVKFIVR